MFQVASTASLEMSDDEDDAPHQATVRAFMSDDGTARIDARGIISAGKATFSTFAVCNISPRSMTQFNSVTKSTPPYALLNQKVFPKFEAASFLKFSLTILIRALSDFQPLHTLNEVLTVFLDQISKPQGASKSAVRSAVRSFVNWHNACKTILIDESHRNAVSALAAKFWKIEDDLIAVGAAHHEAHRLLNGPLYSHLGPASGGAKDEESAPVPTLSCIPAYREMVLRDWYDLRFSLYLGIVYARVFPMRGSGFVKGAHDVRISPDAATSDVILRQLETAFVYPFAEWHETFVATCTSGVGSRSDGVPVFLKDVK